MLERVGTSLAMPEANPSAITPFYDTVKRDRTLAAEIL